MKETRNQGTEKLLSVWKNITSNITNKINNNNNISNYQKKARDMGETHTPISHIDLSGLNKERAKEVIDKLIDEKLERVSHLELSELKIDYKERERQRAKAADRINERRTRRKQKSTTAVETIVTEEGVYSDYKHASIFDVIQPEAFPYELEKIPEPIEGQLSIIESLAVEEHEIIPQEIIPQENSGKTNFFEGMRINTSIDDTIDKVFAFYEKNKVRLTHFCKKNASEILPDLE